MRRNVVVLSLLVLLALVFNSFQQLPPDTAFPPGLPENAYQMVVGEPAMVRISYEGKVGIILDTLPAHLKNYVKNKYLTASQAFWLDRAKRQYKFSWYFLEWRNYFLPGKHQIPHTAEDLWNFQLLQDTPVEESIESVSINDDTVRATHDYITMRYKFQTYVLTDSNSLNVSEPDLGSVGSIVVDDIMLPIDPDSILSRTGYACMDEAEFPPSSVDWHNAHLFFDPYCGVEDSSISMYKCHVSYFPSTDCMTALVKNVGYNNIRYTYERIQWDEKIAQIYRYTPGAVKEGEVPLNEEGSNIKVMSSHLHNNRIEYRYFKPDHCAMVEGCIKEPGWRRVLKFDAATVNTGTSPMHVGSVAQELASSMIRNNVYEFSTCHQHWHFQFYANYTFGSKMGNKQAWCLESINRVWNHENVSINTPYWYCGNQGIQVGWSDEYIAGIDCQWIDITEVKESTTDYLSIRANPNGFLCEGKPITYPNGSYQFEPTNFLSQINKLPVSKPRCAYRKDFEDGNYGSTYYYIPQRGSAVTETCPYEVFGYDRDCGFAELGHGKCTPGQDVTLKAYMTIRESVETNTQVLRVCEYSQKLQSTIACVQTDAIAQFIVTDSTTSITFKCPVGKEGDSKEPGGMFSIFSGNFFSSGQRKVVIVQGVNDNPVPAGASTKVANYVAAILVALLALLVL